MIHRCVLWYTECLIVKISLKFQISMQKTHAHESAFSDLDCLYPIAYKF